MNPRCSPANYTACDPSRPGRSARVAGRLRGLFLLLPWLMAGCSGDYAGGGASMTLSSASQTLPAGRFAAECDKLWQTRDEPSLADAGYWLRAMQCAESLTPSQARLEAAGNGGERWDDAFRESILLDAADITVTERRRAYQRLLGFRSRIPPAVYPVFRLWRQQEALRLILADERGKSQRQLDAAAAQIEQMRQQQQDLQHKLDITTRKLATLTEIERRLSARKQGMTDSDNEGGYPSASGAAGDKTVPTVKP
ncbi:two-component system QseEF-associated lipoprotein QseG [Martelella alba]|nr:two-component system QseEF-associated lipoprotein QseG [Martelella alba]